jgi:hypothetical protein
LKPTVGAQRIAPLFMYSTTLNMIKKSGRMTLTFNKELYSELLSKYQPKIIKNENDNDYFLVIVEELMSRNKLTPEEDSLLELNDRDVQRSH